MLCIYVVPPPRFGNRIIIEKRITHGAGGHWKLYNSSHKVVTDIKPDVVLKQMSVNAANPLTIITQDMARAFLSGKAAGGLQNAQDAFRRTGNSGNCHPLLIHALALIR